MAIEVISEITLKNNLTFPIANANNIKGGLYSVSTIEERDSIPESRRSEGMLCYVLDEQIYYSYIENKWIEAEFESTPVGIPIYSLDNIDEDAPDEYITIVKDNDEEYTTYYTRTTNMSYDEEGNPLYTYVYNELTLTQNTEITDAENLTGYFNAPTTFAEFQLNSGNSKDRLIIPPDFFYGAASLISGNYSTNAILSYDYAFACKTELQGIIPEHIFKNAPAGSCQYTFYNMNVIPVLRATGTDGINTTNVYTCYPDDYTTYTDLTYAFASKPVIPLDQNYSDYSIYNYVLIISDNTIPTTVLMMDYAFYYTSNNAYIAVNNNSSITYKINLIGSWSENQDGSLTVTLGFDLTKFTSLRCDYLFTGKLTLLLYGNMFSDTSYYSNFMYESDDTYVLIGYHGSYGLSPNIIFPKLTSGSLSYGRSPYRIITDRNTSISFSLKSSLIMDPVNDITDYSNIFTFYE